MRVLLFLLITITLFSCETKAPVENKEKPPSIAAHIESDKNIAVLGSHRINTYSASLNAIRERKHLRVLTSVNSFNYFVHNGQQKGYEFEMARKFTDSLNKKFGFAKEDGLIVLEIIPVHRDELILLLNEGYGDIAAAGLTITPERKKEVVFSIPYNRVNEVLVLNSAIKVPADIEELSGQQIAVRKSSSYYESLLKVQRQLTEKGLPSMNIVELEEDVETEAIIEMVSLGKFEMTIADSHIADIAENLFPNITLQKEIPLREEAPIAWAVPKGATKLLEELNSFIPAYRKGALMGNINLKKYYASIDRIGSESFNQMTRNLSPYDDIMREYAKKYQWDWRLLAALCYRESKFRQDIKNKWGAIGLFQIKQATANEKYVNIREIEGKQNARNNIHAGIKYLTWLRTTYFSKPEIKKEDQIRLSLAAYNAGPGRLRQAREKAKEMGLNPNIWRKNVEYALLSMGYTEPVYYVSAINNNFLSYAILGF